MTALDRVIEEREIKIKILKQQIDTMDIELLTMYKELDYFIDLKKRSSDQEALKLVSWYVLCLLIFLVLLSSVGLVAKFQMVFQLLHTSYTNHLKW